MIRISMFNKMLLNIVNNLPGNNFQTIDDNNV